MKSVIINFMVYLDPKLQQEENLRKDLRLIITAIQRKDLGRFITKMGKQKLLDLRDGLLAVDAKNFSELTQEKIIEIQNDELRKWSVKKEDISTFLEQLDGYIIELDNEKEKFRQGKISVPEFTGGIVETPGPETRRKI